MFILFFCCSAKRIVGRGRNGQGEEPCRVDPFNADNQAEKRTNQEKKTCGQKASLKLNLRLANSLRSNNARLDNVLLRDASSRLGILVQLIDSLISWIASPSARNDGNRSRSDLLIRHFILDVTSTI